MWLILFNTSQVHHGQVLHKHTSYFNQGMSKSCSVYMLSKSTNIEIQEYQHNLISISSSCTHHLHAPVLLPGEDYRSNIWQPWHGMTWELWSTYNHITSTQGGGERGDTPICGPYRVYKDVLLHRVWVLPLWVWNRVYKSAFLFGTGSIIITFHPFRLWDLSTLLFCQDGPVNKIMLFSLHI